MVDIGECGRFECSSPNSGYTEGVLTVRVKAGFDQGTRSDLVVSSAQECRFEILC